ncbi:MAG: protein kinase, partial [Gemmatimonadota bacterium]|nr:protein kinase [Gemmatimonadota bacterium]
EARLASAIQHPNVCAIYEAGQYRKRPYIVMQQVPGRTLETLLESGGLDLRLALSIGIQVASGLAHAHRLKILHRDLKPANIMITDDGVAKILDFGLARRRPLPLAPEAGDGGELATPDASSSSFGTTAYMAPEQFVTRRSSEQSDVYALGVILYQMATGEHPFWVPGVPEAQLVRAIQFNTPAAPRRMREEVPEALERLILEAIDRQPSSRVASASELAEGLKTVMKTLDLELGTIPGESSAVLPNPPAGTKKPAGAFSALVDRFVPRETGPEPEDAIAVLPFRDLGESDLPRYYGLALAEMVATRLAAVPSLVLRPPSAFLSLDEAGDELEAARRADARYALSGSYLRSDEGFTATWRLSDASDRTLIDGSTLSFPALDLLRIQNEIADEVVGALHRIGIVQRRKERGPIEALPEAVSEEYLRARALLVRFLWSSSLREDLDRAREGFESVVEDAPEFASGHAGLGIAHLQSVIHGFGGLSHFMSAQRHLEKALAVDPEHREARLNRAYTYLWRGEKASARHDIEYLLRHAPADGEVLFGAGVIVQLDGLLEEALRLFDMALRANPGGATRIYNRRARIYQYMDRLDLAWSEVEKGLALEPNHALLRTTRGYLLFREGKLDEAVDALDEVLASDPGRRLTHPTLAMCHVRAGQPERAKALITDELLAVAAADCEMAYRLATYCVVDGNETEALHWLRKAVYLGNENHPWLSRNPLWEGLHGTPDFRRIMADLERTWEKNRGRWAKFFREEMSGRWS